MSAALIVAEPETETRGLFEKVGLHAEHVKIGVRELADLYGLADALVLTSQNEGFGLPMLEAGLRRLPIICTDIPALRESGGDEATYVPLSGDGKAFARAIEARLKADPIARAHRRARENEWPRILAELVLPAIHGTRAVERGVERRKPRG